jgi:hypothetical protein
VNRITYVMATCFVVASVVACGESQQTVNEPQSQSAQAKFDPLSLIKMTDFSGPEAEGFHDCFWIGPVSYESYNIAYPDEGAVYWGAKFQMPQGASHLEIEGNYPDARYLSYNAYDKLTQPTDALIDHQIVPMEGANPFAEADKSGGKYRVKVVAAEAPATDRPANPLYLGSVENRNNELPLVLRIYVPAANTDYTGGAGLPEVTLVMKNGEKLTAEAMCQAINSPAPGAEKRKLPSVVMENATYKDLVYGPGAPAGFPAAEKIQWLKFWGGKISISRLLHNRKFLQQAIADSAAGTLAKQSGFYANIHNDYIGAYLNESFGELVVLRGKMPGTPANGWDITSGQYDLRYWSLCSNESIVTTRYSDCVYDSNVVLDADRNYTIVVSKAANRPANASKECGVTWLDWGEHGDGAGDPKQAYLILRNMEGDNFRHSVQNVRSIASAEAEMGPYFPVSSYSSKAGFAASGCNAAE